MGIIRMLRRVWVSCVVERWADRRRVTGVCTRRWLDVVIKWGLGGILRVRGILVPKCIRVVRSVRWVCVRRAITKGTVWRVYWSSVRGEAIGNS